MANPVASRINRLLKAQGIPAQLIRCRAGYYYLVPTPNGPDNVLNCASLYVWRLDAEDFALAARHVQTELAAIGYTFQMEG